MLIVCHTNDSSVAEWLVAALCLKVLNFPDNALAVDDLAEYNMLVVQVWCGNGGNEELGAVGAWCCKHLSLPPGFQSKYVPGPAFAMLNKNGFSCTRSKFSSSNFSP
jgi:hypothetical protein